jgi:hypothetical protein
MNLQSREKVNATSGGGEGVVWNFIQAMINCNFLECESAG